MSSLSKKKVPFFVLLCISLWRILLGTEDSPFFSANLKHKDCGTLEDPILYRSLKHLLKLLKNVSIISKSTQLKKYYVNLFQRLRISFGYALVSMQQALLGTVTPALRAVIVNMNADAKLLYVRFYYDEAMDEKAIDLWECAIQKSKADFGSNFFLDAEIERLDYPQTIPCLGRYAYLRKE